VIHGGTPLALVLVGALGRGRLSAVAQGELTTLSMTTPWLGMAVAV
jgi:hypothetical protein